MPKSLRTFLEDCQKEIPNEIVRITKPVDPAHYDVTAIIKHLGALKKFPILIFEQPLNLHSKISDLKLVMNCEISQHKTQITLDLPKKMNRTEIAEACLELEERHSPPMIIDKKSAPVKEVVKVR